MSGVNLGEGVGAIRRLYTGDFDHDPKEMVARQLLQQIVDGLLEQVRRSMNTALDCTSEARPEHALGYARALRDVWLSMNSAALGQASIRPSVDNPGPIAKPPRTA